MAFSTRQFLPFLVVLLPSSSSVASAQGWGRPHRSSLQIWGFSEDPLEPESKTWCWWTLIEEVGETWWVTKATALLLWCRVVYLVCHSRFDWSWRPVFDFSVCTAAQSSVVRTITFALSIGFPLGRRRSIRDECFRLSVTRLCGRFRHCLFTLHQTKEQITLNRTWLLDE